MAASVVQVDTVAVAVTYATAPPITHLRTGVGACRGAAAGPWALSPSWGRAYRRYPGVVARPSGGLAVRPERR